MAGEEARVGAEAGVVAGEQVGVAGNEGENCTYGSLSCIKGEN